MLPPQKKEEKQAELKQEVTSYWSSLDEGLNEIKLAARQPKPDLEMDRKLLTDLFCNIHSIRKPNFGSLSLIYDAHVAVDRISLPLTAHVRKLL